MNFSVKNLIKKITLHLIFIQKIKLLRKLWPLVSFVNLAEIKNYKS